MASKKMICPCLKVTKDDIIDAVEQGASSFKDVKKQTKIVSKCGKCKDRVKCFVREVFIEKGLIPEEEKSRKIKKSDLGSSEPCIHCENSPEDCPLQNTHDNGDESKKNQKLTEEKKLKKKKDKKGIKDKKKEKEKKSIKRKKKEKDKKSIKRKKKEKEKKKY